MMETIEAQLSISFYWLVRRRSEGLVALSPIGRQWGGLAPVTALDIRPQAAALIG